MLQQQSRPWFGMLLVVGLAVVAGGLLALRGGSDQAPDNAAPAVMSTTDGLATAAETSAPSTTTAPPDGVAVLAPICVPGPDGYRRAPDEWYLDEPARGFEVSDLRAVRQYASTLDGFEQEWTNPGSNTWIHVGFVGVDVVQRQRELEEQFPDIGVVAVELDHSADELDALAAEVEDLLPEGMAVAYTHVKSGTIDVWVGKVTEEDRRALALLIDDYPLCAAGLVGDLIGEAGPQQTSGDGWRLLAQAEWGVGRQPRVVTTDTQLEDLWTHLMLIDPLPVVDWQRDIVVAFEIGFGSSCPNTRFEGVAKEGKQIRAIIIDPTLLEPGSTHPACTSDYNARTYVVTVARDLLPAPPFTIRSMYGQTLDVPADVDLREPGAKLQPYDEG